MDLALGIVPTVTPMSGGSIASGVPANATDNNDATLIQLGGGITSGLQYHVFAFDIGFNCSVDHVEVKCVDTGLDGDQFSAEAWRWWRVRVSDDGATWTDLATGLLNIPLVGWDNSGQVGIAVHEGGYTDALPAAVHRYWEYSFGKNHGLQGYGALSIVTLSLIGDFTESVGNQVVVI